MAEQEYYYGYGRPYYMNNRNNNEQSQNDNGKNQENGFSQTTARTNRLAENYEMEEMPVKPKNLFEDEKTASDNKNSDISVYNILLKIEELYKKINKVEINLTSNINIDEVFSAIKTKEKNIDIYLEQISILDDAIEKKEAFLDNIRKNYESQCEKYNGIQVEFNNSKQELNYKDFEIQSINQKIDEKNKIMKNCTEAELKSDAIKSVWNELAKFYTEVGVLYKEKGLMESKIGTLLQDLSNQKNNIDGILNDITTSESEIFSLATKKNEIEIMKGFEDEDVAALKNKMKINDDNTSVQNTPLPQVNTGVNIENNSVFFGKYAIESKDSSQSNNLEKYESILQVEDKDADHIEIPTIENIDF